MQHPLALRAGQRGLAHPDAAPGIPRWESLSDKTVGDEAVDRSVDVQVDSEVEIVVVIDGNHVLIHEAAVRVCGFSPWAIPVIRTGAVRVGLGHASGFNLGNSCGADGDAYRTILLKAPIKDVVIIPQHGRTAHNQIALAPALGIFG